MSNLPVVLSKFVQIFKPCFKQTARCHSYIKIFSVNKQTNRSDRLSKFVAVCNVRQNSTNTPSEEKEADVDTKAYLKEMGFDTKRIENKRPTTLKKTLGQIQSNIHFFRHLKLEDKVIHSIVSRQPVLLTVSLDHLQNHVTLLQDYELTLEEIGQVISRAPKLFSVPIETIKGNILFLEGIQLVKRKIRIILLYYPTTFSRKINGIEQISNQIVDLLKTHITLDDDSCKSMLRAMVMACPKLFIRSPGEIARNVQFLESLGFTDKSLYSMVRFCPETLRVYPHYIQTKYDFVQKLFSLDQLETVKLITRYPKFINFQPTVLQQKVDNLQALGFTLKQIQDQPRIFSFSVDTTNRRYKSLIEAGYEFKTLRLLTLSEAKINDEIHKLK